MHTLEHNDYGDSGKIIYFASETFLSMTIDVPRSFTIRSSFGKLNATVWGPFTSWHKFEIISRIFTQIVRMMFNLNSQGVFSDKKKNRSEHIEKVHVLNNKFYMLTKITQLKEQVSTE